MQPFVMIRDALSKRAEYIRVKSEIERMPLEVAIDLDMNKFDAARIASEAVYGR